MTTKIHIIIIAFTTSGPQMIITITIVIIIYLSRNQTSNCFQWKILPLSIVSKNSSLFPARMASITRRCDRSPGKLSIRLETNGCIDFGSAFLPSNIKTNNNSTSLKTSSTHLEDTCSHC